MSAIGSNYAFPANGYAIFLRNFTTAECPPDPTNITDHLWLAHLQHKRKTLEFHRPVGLSNYQPIGNRLAYVRLS